MVIRAEAISPEINAPINKISVFLLPIIRNAVTIPGNAALEMQSLIRHCLRNNEKQPKAPLIIPNSADPNATVWNV